MIEPARALVLVHERVPRRVAAAGSGTQDFQRDVGAAPRIVCAPDFGLATDANALMQDVTRPERARGVHRCHVVHYAARMP